MKTKVLTAVSAAALLGISSFALAQSSGSGSGGGSGSSSAPPANTMQRQQDAPPAGSPSSGSTSSGSMSGDRMTQDKDKDSTKSRAQSPDTQKSPTQSQSGQMGKDSKSNQAQTPSTDSKSQMSQDKDGAKSGSTVGAAGAGSVNLTTEQRTTIRQEVLTSSAPRATNINFSVNVGTVVPSSVRVVEVPTTIVKIHPQWKGYRYFVYNDDIIIIEPRSLKIVAVLNV